MLMWDRSQPMKRFSKCRRYLLTNIMTTIWIHVIYGTLTWVRENILMHMLLCGATRVSPFNIVNRCMKRAETILCSSVFRCSLWKCLCFFFSLHLMFCSVLSGLFPCSKYVPDSFYHSSLQTFAAETWSFSFEKDQVSVDGKMNEYPSFRAR